MCRPERANTVCAGTSVAYVQSCCAPTARSRSARLRCSGIVTTVKFIGMDSGVGTKEGGRDAEKAGWECYAVGIK